MDEMECYDCGEWFEFDIGDIHTQSEIVEGQYVERSAVTCPHCGLENTFG